MRILFIFFLVLTACSTENATTDASEATDTVRYAKHFTIVESDDSLHISIYAPNDHSLEKTLALPKALKHSKIVALSSTHIGMLAKLDALNHIVGISNINYVFNSSVKAGVENGNIIQLGEESNIPLEHIIQMNPNFIVYSGFGKSFPHEQQLEKLNIHCVQNYDWEEAHPLGKAEWIKVMGAMVGEYENACTYFDALAKEYLALVQNQTQQQNHKTLLSGNVWGDTWHCPAGESFNAQLFDLAGFNYPYALTKGSGSLDFTMEQILSENKSAEIWINPGAESLEDLKVKNPKAIHFDAFHSGNVFCYSPKAKFFWEMSAIEPQHVLTDLIRINAGDLEDSLYFYSRLE